MCLRPLLSFVRRHLSREYLRQCKFKSLLAEGDVISWIPNALSKMVDKIVPITGKETFSKTSSKIR